MRLIHVNGIPCRRLRKDEHFAVGDWWSFKPKKGEIWHRLDRISMYSHTAVQSWVSYVFARPIDPLIAAMWKAKFRRTKKCK